MAVEQFKPIAVQSPTRQPWLFRVRCLLDLQLATIVRYLRPELAKLHGRVIDVGAGESPWRDWLPSSVTYQGIDVGNATEFGMSAGHPDVTYYDGRIMPFADASFDSALCIEVLEHTEDPALCLSEIARVLKPGASLLLTVPWSARRHHIPHDYHRFTRERLEIMFGEHGFENVEIRERGTDIGAIASKLVVLTARLAQPKVDVSLLWRIPLLVPVVPVALGFVAASHVSEALGAGAKEDPLGYFVKATRATSSRG
ncbi:MULTISPECIES: class I SAM-dependent methyltransferase [Dyella]|uniref:class I SAM-dependent methyltransferase n=1 Tax=Dyella TaxID=231454 RepID=UPI00197ABD9F|nr:MULTISPECIES: class I SAM-dependent methyltransferase [Dyella]